jgi:hypothetical protein
MSDSPAKQLSTAERALEPPAKGLPRCHRDVIMLWPTLAECSRETGIPYESVKAMARRNSITDEHRPSIIRAANDRAGAAETLLAREQFAAVTFEMLTRTAPRHGASRSES